MNTAAAQAASSSYHHRPGDVNRPRIREDRYDNHEQTTTPAPTRAQLLEAAEHADMPRAMHAVFKAFIGHYREDEGGKVWPSVARLMKITRYGRRMVYHALKWLRDHGWIEATTPSPRCRQGWKWVGVTYQLAIGRLMGLAPAQPPRRTPATAPTTARLRRAGYRWNETPATDAGTWAQAGTTTLAQAARRLLDAAGLAGGEIESKA